MAQDAMTSAREDNDFRDHGAVDAQVPAISAHAWLRNSAIIEYARFMANDSLK
jgi:hypothetical protein